MNVRSRHLAWLGFVAAALAFALVPFAGLGAQPTVAPGPGPSAAPDASATPSASASVSAAPEPPVLAHPPQRPKQPATPIPRKEPNTDTTISVLTFSPGDHPFYKFGHNAIWVHDPTRPPIQSSMGGEINRDRVFNWGTFTFGDPALIPKFFQGRFMYWLSVQGIRSTQEGYWRENRVIDVQELDLSPAQKTKMIALLEENLANPKYKYNYYEDNCSTRVRDMIDRTLAPEGEAHGPVWAQSQDKGKYTWRQHTLRMTEDLPAEAVILSLVMGNKIDQPLTRWQEQFLPGEFHEDIGSMQITWEDGTQHALVKKAYRMQPPMPRKPIPDPRVLSESPPSWWWVGLLVGLALGGLNALLGYGGKRAYVSRLAFSIVVGVEALVIGFLGCFFIGAWIGTDHEVGYHNENMLHAAPFAILLVGGAIRIAMRDRLNHFVASGLLAVASTTSVLVGRYVTFWTGVIWFVFWAVAFGGYLLREDRLRKVVTAATALSLLGVVLKVLPFFNQQNWLFIAFFVPFWLGTLFGIRSLKLAISDIPSIVRKPVAAAPAAEVGEPKKNKKKKKRPVEAASVADKSADTPVSDVDEKPTGADDDKETDEDDSHEKNDADSSDGKDTDADDKKRADDTKDADVDDDGADDKKDDKP